MTNVTVSYDAIITKAEALFASKTRLHNPYELTDNPEIIMRNAWGLKVSPAERVDIEFCNLSISREYSFILLRQFATVGNNETAFDAVTAGLLEDQQTFLNHLWSQTELSIPDTIDEIQISNIGGIEFMQADQKKYLFTEITFRITVSTAVI